MALATSTSPRLLEERGAITWVTLLLVTGLLAGAYLLWMWVPAYVVDYEVKQVVRDYGNRAVKEPDDARLVQDMAHKIRTLAETTLVGDDGRPVRVPAVDLRPEQVTWERSSSPPTLHVAFEYPRQIAYPLLDRVAEKVFRIDMTIDISRADWGPSR
jgi:hypothetical protein